MQIRVSASKFLIILSAIFLIFSSGCQLTAYLQEEPVGTGPFIQTEPASITTLTLTPSPSPSSGRDLMGIEIRRLDEMDQLNRLGANWVRWNGILWHSVEIEQGNRDWSVVADLEDSLVAASEQGLEVILIVRGTPSWAQRTDGSFCGPIREDKLDEFGSFVTDLVTRYSASPYNVRYWELGNEPDIDASLIGSDSVFGCWGDIDDPYYGGGYYAEMLKVVYPRIKAVDPDAQILVGGLLVDCDPVNPPKTQPESGQLKDCTPSKFLEGVLSNGGGDYFDGVSFHAYDYYAASFGKYSNINWHSSWDTTGPVVVPKARFLKEVLASYGYANKYLINSESALLCGRDATEDYCLTEEFALTKAYYLAQSFAAARAGELHANIWFTLRGWRGSALIDDSAQPNMAYQAFAFSAELLEGSAYVGEVSLYPNVKGYEFTKDGVRTWLIWAQDDQTHPIHLDEGPAAIYDVMGNALPASQEVNVTLAPVYVQWLP